jgi:hypothetical protein
MSVRLKRFSADTLQYGETQENPGGCAPLVGLVPRSPPVRAVQSVRPSYISYHPRHRENRDCPRRPSPPSLRLNIAQRPPRRVRPAKWLGHTPWQCTPLGKPRKLSSLHFNKPGVTPRHIYKPFTYILATWRRNPAPAPPGALSPPPRL